MEQVVSLQQLVDARRKEKSIHVIRKDLKECMHAVLRTITLVMNPSTLFNGITKLLGHRDRNVEKKVGIACFDVLTVLISVFSLNKPFVSCEVGISCETGLA